MAAGPLDFLSGPPTPVGEVEPPNPADFLPQSTADALLKLEGVVGAWIERDAAGQRLVALHVSTPTTPDHLPDQVEGMPVKVVGGEPIRAQF